MLLLEESLGIPSYIVEKSSSKGGRLVVEGIGSLTNFKNSNGRVYTEKVWRKVLDESSPFMMRLRRGLVFGMVEHPQDGRTRIKELSHKLDEVWLDQTPKQGCPACEARSPHSHIMVRATIANTPCGNILREIYELSGSCGLSSRGTGTTTRQGDVAIVNEDFKLDTFDHVLDPSTPGAYMRAVIKESVAGIVERLIDDNCSEDDLRAYKRILSSVLNKESDEGVRADTASLIENINSRLSRLSRNPVSVPVGPADRNQYEVILEKGDKSGVINHDNNTEDFMTTPLDDHEVREIVSRSVQEAEERVRRAYEDELARVNDIASSLREQLEDTEARLIAAEKLGNELLSQLKEHKIKLQAYEGSINGSSNLAERFETSKEIIRELVKRVQNSRIAEQRSRAAEMLLSEVVARVRRERLGNHVERLLNNVSESKREQVKTLLLEGTSTIEEANRKFSALSSVITEDTRWPSTGREVRTDGGLPTARNLLAEETLYGNASSSSTGREVSRQISFTRSLVKRMNSATL